MSTGGLSFPLRICEDVVDLDRHSGFVLQLRLLHARVPVPITNEGRLKRSADYKSNGQPSFARFRGGRFLGLIPVVGRKGCYRQKSAPEPAQPLSEWPVIRSGPGSRRPLADPTASLRRSRLCLSAGRPFRLSSVAVP